jgi:hypothetical protein
MKVYELIQELVQYNADDDVTIAFSTEVEGNCSSCKEEISLSYDNDNLTIDSIDHPRHSYHDCQITVS